MPAQYRVRLRPAERAELTAMTRSGIVAARELTRARAVLLADRGLRDTEIASATGLSARTVQRLRRRTVEHGIQDALHDRPRPGAPPMLDAGQEAVVVALACTDAPAGRAVWTMQLLADHLVRLEVVPRISDETVRRTLKKTSLSPGSGRTGASPA